MFLNKKKTQNKILFCHILISLKDESFLASFLLPNQLGSALINPAVYRHKLQLSKSFLSSPFQCAKDDYRESVKDRWGRMCSCGFVSCIIFLSCLLILSSAFFFKFSPILSKFWEYFLYSSILWCCSPEQLIGELFQHDLWKELALEK